MKTEKKNLPIESKIVLSTLWIFVLINMIYADIMGMLRPGYLELLEQASKELTSGVVLTFSILLEIPIILILLSRILSRKWNRICNFIAVPISIIYVIFGGLTNPPISYIFFATIEIIALLIIFYIACKWPKHDMIQG
ncbi:hypothetical protein A8C32_12695 [Flavivirga aquatica]|uniref:DoxX family protein n=1 Tax=Flavivirga aquatica TaxID=1849968 RepID=A0A1E5TDT9_9FLAO|nr:DUF6326 family protein [Flavivirga aquatica]OEK09556.1 hypothetical protein A8C32_12695 [Flavivirga aquatica]